MGRSSSPVAVAAAPWRSGVRLLTARGDLVVVCVLFAALVASGIVSFLGRPTENGTGTSYSSYSAGPDGTLGLYRWLARRGYHVQRVEAAPFTLQTTPLGALFVLAPAVSYTDDEARLLLAWIAGGGTAIVALDSPDPALLAALGAHLRPLPRASAVAVQPLLERPPLLRLAVPASTGVAFDAPDSVTYLSAGAGPGAAAVLIGRHIGRGMAYLLGAPDALSNQGIRRGDDRRLALNLLADLPGGAAVGFDEFHQGIQTVAPRDVSDLLFTAAPGKTLLYGGLLTLIYLLWSGRRLGRPLTPRRPPGRSIEEYIVSLGALYRRSGARADALALLTRAFTAEMSERYHLGGFPPTSPLQEDPAAVADALRQRGLLNDAAASELRALLNAPSGAPLSEADLLRRVQALDALRDEVGTARS